MEKSIEEVEAQYREVLAALLKIHSLDLLKLTVAVAGVTPELIDETFLPSEDVRLAKVKEQIAADQKILPLMIDLRQLLEDLYGV